MSSMDKPVLLVLGGGLYQLPVVRAARAIGLRVAVVDRSPDVPAREVADIFENIDTRNVDTVAEFAARAKVSGVIAPCTDHAVQTQARVAKRLGLPGPPIQAAAILTHKTRFRMLLDRLGLPAPKWRQVDCGNAESAPLGGGSYILKPAQSSGSKGVFIVDNENFAERLAETRRFCFENRAIVEEFIEGHQGTVEGLWLAGQFKLAVFTERMTAPAPYVATTGHRIPSRLSSVHKKEILRQIELLLGNLSIRNCAFDCDFVIGPKEAYLIELTPRLGGNSLSKLLLLAKGVDLVSAAISLSLTANARQAIPSTTLISTRDVPAAILLLGSDRDGFLDFDDAGLAELQELEWVEEITLDVPKGVRVNQFVNGRERIGEALITGANYELDERIAYLKNRLGISAIPS